MLAGAVFQFAAAQQSEIVPQELQGGFESSGVELQVSYTGDAVNGFLDGASFSKDGMCQPTPYTRSRG